MRVSRDLVVEVKDVEVTYEAEDGTQKQALQGVNLAIQAGEFVAVIGHNGSGKSTLAKLLNGLLLPSAGTVLVGGLDTRDPRHLHDIHAVVGMVFQDPETQMVATNVEEDIAFGLENYEVPVDEMRKRVEQSLRWVGMWDARHRAPHQLSGGQKQRVAIAAVMAMRPRCIVFDEATSMIDADGRESVMEAIARMHAEGMAIVLVTHQMSEASLADRVVVMHQGRIAADGPPRDVFRALDDGQEWHVEPPIALDVAHQLRAWGWNLAGTPMEAEELATAMAETVLEASREGRLPARASSRFRSVVATHPVPSETPIVQIRDLQHAYMRGTPMQQTALRGVSLDVWPGELVALVGRTGSGKSTLVQHLNGLMRPQAGTVVVDGISLHDRKPDLRTLRRRVGVAFQNPEDQLFESLIGDDVAYGPFQYGLPLIEVRERVKVALESVGLSFAWRDRSVHGLSGGERRKVALAGVLAMQPKLLILDEPTAGLDPQSRRDIGRRIQRLQQEGGMTVIWVTHQLEEAAEYATRVCVMEDGQVAVDGQPGDLFADETVLRAHHLRLPEAPQLAKELRALGMPVAGVPLTRDELAADLDGVLRNSVGGLAWRN